ncbi:hypothetical protein BDV96DRAFT_636749 [Lophiotrema nucula]|uniref:Uncharacterized protein n=1 Tax=Lophiotrema nucula TaxID=690887 RepID=A0A6A5YP13_9PLEO|nr:hypothetical protein BDV96DRAFT_636749 [Lophiotrema nucula]
MTETWPSLELATPEQITAYHSLSGLPPIPKPPPSPFLPLPITQKDLSAAASLYAHTNPHSEILIHSSSALRILTQTVTLFQAKYAKYQAPLGLTPDSKSLLLPSLERYIHDTCTHPSPTSCSRYTTLAHLEQELKTYLQLLLAQFIARSKVLLSAVEEINPNLVAYLKPKANARTEKGRVLHGGPGCHVLQCVRWLVGQEGGAIKEIWEVWEELVEMVVELLWYSYTLRDG